MSKNRRRPQRTVQRSKVTRWQPAWDPEYVAPDLPPVKRMSEEWVPDNWQEAWVGTTIDVVDLIWRQHAWRMYRDDEYQRDDLYSWLWVQAQEFANKYDPHRHPTAERAWGGTLYNVLSKTVRWHWSEQQTKRLPSIDAVLDRAAKADGGRLDYAHAIITRGVLWAHDNTTSDPERFTMFIELADHLAHGGVRRAVKDPGLCIEEGCQEPQRRYARCDRHSQVYVTHWNPAGTRCTVDGCPEPVRARGLCTTHYGKARREWLAPTPCSEDGCDSPVSARGLCRAHHAERSKAGTLPPKTAQPERRCEVDGCSSKHKSHGLCRQHYEEQRRLTASSCSEPGCTKPEMAKGLCSMHYSRARRAAAA